MPGGQKPNQVGGEMRREHAFYGAWCRLFEFHLKRLGLPASSFAVRAKRSQQAIHSYLSGRARPPLDQLTIWAAMLGLHGEERERFVLAGAEAHVPQPIYRRLVELERLALEAKAAKAPPSELRDRLTLAEGVVAELVGLLRDVESLFFLRMLPVDRIRAERQRLQPAVRRAIERYAKAE